MKKIDKMNSLRAYITPAIKVKEITIHSILDVSVPVTDNKGEENGEGLAKESSSWGNCWDE